MIYDHHYNKPFDDGIIRSVDLLVNRVFNRYEDYVVPQLSAYQNSRVQYADSESAEAMWQDGVFAKVGGALH